MWNWKIQEDYLEEVADLLAHPEVRGMEELPQHASGVSCLHHSLLVSYFSFRLCRRLGLDARAAARGGLLHDFYLYNWQDKATHPDVSHAFDHPLVALENARARFPLTPKEEDIIATHMFPLALSRPYRCGESLVVSTMDKVCALAELLHLFPAPSAAPALAAPSRM